MLADTNTCAGKAMQKLKNMDVANLDKVCPGAKMDIPVATALVLATMKRESDGNPNDVGDGGRSRGLLQTTTGDNFSDCKSGNQADPTTGLKCGLCEMFEPVSKSGVLYGKGATGLGKQFGPWRRSLAGQIADAKTACKAVGNPGGRSPAMAGGPKGTGT